MNIIERNIPRLIKVKRIGCVSLLGLLIALMPYTSQALPQDGVVAAGQADINYSNNNLDINQHTDRAIIDWRSFNIGSAESVNFYQPGSNSIALNRVNDANPTSILGSLKANGKVMLVNPNGVFFGQGAVVDVSGLTATTANITNANFMAGKMDFDQQGNPNAKIRNEGNITVKQAGLVAFVAPTVENSGTIKAQMGKVHLAGADSFSMDMNGDGITKIAVSTDVVKQMVAQDGIIEANGGEVHLTTAAASHAVDSLIRHTGVTQANTVEQKGGVIRLSAGKTGGTSKVEVAGTIKANGTDTGQKAGSIAITGKTVQVKQTAKLEANGAVKGGEILIGGDYKGGNYSGTSESLKNIFDANDFTHADYVWVDEGAVIDASSGFGDAGRVILWSDKATSFAGTINTIGANAGGFVETSSKGFLSVTGFVNAGKGGSWLLDPRNVIISTYGTNHNIPGSGGIVDPSGEDDYSISAASISTALSNGNNVTITTGSDGTQGGDITISYADINKTGGGEATLTLQAERDIYMTNSHITSTSDKLNVVMNADRNADGLGGVRMESSNTITTNNGNIIIGGGANPYTTAAGFYTGANSDGYSVLFDSTTTNTGSGNVLVHAKTAAQNAYGTGLLLRYASINTTTGNVGLYGETGSNALNTAVRLYAYHINTETGAITIDGRSQNGQGAMVEYYSSITSTGTGAGVGAINIYGEGTGSNTLAAGVISNSTISVVDAALTIEGKQTSGMASTDAHGVAIASNSSIASTGNSANTGNIIIKGTGSLAGQFNHGLRVSDGGSITTNKANIDLTGEAGLNTLTQGNEGVSIYYDGLVKTTGSGNITITGIGHGSVTSSNNHGVRISQNGKVNAEGSGAVNITGTAGGGNDSSGVHIDNGKIIANQGTLDVTGNVSAEVGSSRRGIVVTNSGGAITGGDGNVTITGTSAAGNSGGNHGVELSYNAMINTTGTGNIILKGTAGAGTGGNNHGVLVGFNSTINNLGGSINIEATGGGDSSTDYNFGLLLQYASGINAYGSGSVDIKAIGGYGSNSTDIKMDNWSNSITTSNTNFGTITLNANTLELLSGSIDSGGSIVIKPRTAGTTIGIAGGAGTLNLTQSEMDTLNARENIIIGDINSGAANIGALTINYKSYDLVVNASTIDFEGALSFNSANDFLFNATNGNILLDQYVTKTDGADSIFKLKATGDITVSNSHISADGSNKLGVILNSDSDSNGAGGVKVEYATINTKGGDVIIGGGVNPSTTRAGTYSTDGYGVLIDNTNINTLAGNISVMAKGQSTNASVDGTKIQFSNLTTTSGNIKIDSQATGSASGHGLNLYAGHLTTTSGAIDVTGESEKGNGVQVDYYSDINSTGTGAGIGAVTIIGKTQADHSSAVIVNNNSSINVADAALNIEGEIIGSLNLTTRYGVSLSFNSLIKSTGNSVNTGDVTITGKGGNGSLSENVGVSLKDSSIIEVNKANLVLEGTSGQNTIYENNYGVRLFNDSIIRTVGAGNLSITGIGGGENNNNNHGIFLDQNSVITSTSSGNIIISGTSGGGDLSSGIYLKDSQVTSTGTGDISLTGIVDNTKAGTQRKGIYLSGSNIHAVDGDITLDGTGGNGASANNNGIELAATSTVGSDDGLVDITGYGGASTGVDNNGVYIHSTSKIENGKGTINVNGTGGSGVGNNNHGIKITDSSGVIMTGAGDINLTAIKGGSANAHDLVINTGTNTIGSATMLGTVTLNVNDLGSFTNIVTKTLGDVIIKPRTASTTIGLGDLSTGNLKLTNAQLNSFQNAGKLVIGNSTSGTGAVDIGDLNTTTTANIEVYGGNINFSGLFTSLNSASFIARVGGIGLDQYAGIDSTGGNIKLHSYGNITLGDLASIGSSNNVELTSTNGDINLASDDSLSAYVLSLTAKNIDLGSNSSIYAHDLNLTADNKITISSANNTVTVGNSTTMLAGGDIDINTAIAHLLDITSTAGKITWTNSAINIAAGSSLISHGALKLNATNNSITIGDGTNIASNNGNIDMFAHDNISISGTSLAPTSINSGTGHIVLVADNQVTPGTGNLSISSDVNLAGSGGVRLYAPDVNYTLNGTVNGTAILTALGNIIYSHAYNAGDTGSHLYVKDIDRTPVIPPVTPPVVLPPVASIPEQVNHVSSRQFSTKVLSNLNLNDVIKKGNDTLPIGNSIFDMPLSKMTWQVLINDSLVDTDNSSNKKQMKVSSL